MMDRHCIVCGEKYPFIMCDCGVARYCTYKCKQVSFLTHSVYQCMTYKHTRLIPVKDLLNYQSSSTYGNQAEKKLADQTAEYLRKIKGGCEENPEEDSIPDFSFYCKPLLDDLLPHVEKMPPWQLRDICDFYKKPWTCASPEALIRDLALDWILLPSFDIEMCMELLYRAARCGKYKRVNPLSENFLHPDKKIYFIDHPRLVSILKKISPEEKRLILTHINERIDLNIEDFSTILLEKKIVYRTYTLEKCILVLKRIVLYASLY